MRLGETAVALLVVLVALAGRVAAAQGAEGGADELLILEVRLRAHVLAAAMPALRRGREVFLPLGELAAALEFPIRVDAAAGTASGWVLDEGRSFALDAGRGQVSLAGDTRPYPSGSVLREPDDLYVAAGELARWFPVDLSVEFANLWVLVQSREPLPVERRIERQRRRARALATRQALDRPALPAAEQPYRWLSWPFVDLAASGERQWRDGGRPGWSGEYSVLATADVARMTGELYAGGDDRGGLAAVTASLSRRDPEGRLLGPLEATELSLGDLFSPPVAMVARSVSGRGAAVSNFPLDRPDQFDRTDIRGSAPPRWEAELYRGESLLAFQVVGADGAYAFPAVPLLYGRNDFTVVLYGPQGQERRVPYRFFAGPGLTEPGGVRYRAALLQGGTDLVPVTDGEADPDGAGELRGSAELEWGAARNLSLALSATAAPGGDGEHAGRHGYLGAGGRFSVGGVYGAVDGVWDVAGGTGLRGSVQSRWWNANWFAEHAQFCGFESEQVGTGDPVLSSTRGRVEWGASLLVPFSATLQWDRERRAGGVREGLGTRLSATLGRLLATHRLEWRRTAGLPETTSGSLLLSTLTSSVSLRGSVEYRLAPLARLDAASATVDWKLPRGGRLACQWSHRFGDGGSGFGVTWSQTFPRLAAQTAARLDGGAGALGAAVSTAVGRAPQSGRWVWRGEPLAASGAVQVRVVFDSDHDGRVGPGDAPLAGVRPTVNGRPAEGAATGAAGLAFLPGLPAHRWVDVGLDEGSLEDPYWVVAPAGHRVLARPGATQTVEFLVQESGEIEGTVYMKRGEDVRGQPRVKVQLLDEQGALVQEVESAFDGFFLFQKVTLGGYTVQVSPKQLSDALLASDGPRRVRLTGEKLVLVGTDFLLVEEPQATGGAGSAQPAAP